LRNVQPEGPYFLGGYSFGGIVALEMAQQLIAHYPEQVLLVLFDTFCPHPGPSSGLHTSAKQIAFMFSDISSGFLKLLRSSTEEKRSQVSRTAKVVKAGIRRRVRDVSLPRAFKNVRSACQEAAEAYVPRAYCGQVILFRSSERPLTRFG